MSTASALAEGLRYAFIETLAQELNCGEIELVVDFYREHGTPEDAADILEVHAIYDKPGDRHYQRAD
jgi:hypothetical protein